MSITALVAKRPLRRGDRSTSVMALQVALRAHGHELVPDGAFGGITEAAVKRFQAAHGLTPNGVVDQSTAAALDGIKLRAPAPLPSALAVAPWLSVMRAITGTREIPGARSNPLILSWRDAIIAKYPELKPNLAWYVNDDTPWCGLGEAFTVSEAGYRPPLAPLYATNWFTAWADGVRLKEPALGAIGVKTRNGGGHVFTYEGEDETHFYGRGCNQSDAVNVQKVAKGPAGGMLGWMWPKAHPLPTGGRVFTSFANAVAGSEA